MEKQSTFWATFVVFHWRAASLVVQSLDADNGNVAAFKFFTGSYRNFTLFSVTLHLPWKLLEFLATTNASRKNRVFHLLPRFSLQLWLIEHCCWANNNCSNNSVHSSYLSFIRSAIARFYSLYNFFFASKPSFQKTTYGQSTHSPLPQIFMFYAVITFSFYRPTHRCLRYFNNTFYTKWF